MNNRTKPLIMCIDDDEVTLKILDRLIKNAGWDVITAGSGRDALKKVKKTRSDIILLDIMMPDMDGYQVCSKLQENDETSYIPVIFVTALGEEQDKAKEILLLRVERGLADRGRHL